MSLDAWLDARTYGAPPVLRSRVLEYVAGGAADSDGGQLLAAAGTAALERVVARPGDRAVALDLLAADGLITLALLWRAEHEPAGLGMMARALTGADPLA